MFDLKSYFDGMSKPQLREAHARAFGQKGLLDNARIQGETLSFYEDKERAKAKFSKMEPWQRKVVNLIYNSGDRGLTYNELRLTIPVAKNRELQSFLLEMGRSYLLWRSSTSSSTVYYGFENFDGCFEILERTPAKITPKALAYQNLIDWHICQVLAVALAKDMKVNNSNLLHRRSFQLCVDGFITAKKISEKIAENELSLIFSFLTGNGWLEQEDACLVPTETALEFIRKNGFRLHQELLTWWIKERFRNNRSHCAKLLKMLEEPMSILDASNLFWVLDPTFRVQENATEITWEYLPRPLRELWLLGFVRFEISGSKVSAVVLEQSAKDWIETSIASIPEQNISCLPNFDLIASTGTSPRVMFMLACLAKVENDETYLRFNLNKDSYLRGLKCGIAESEIENFKCWIKPPVNVASTLSEWNSSYYGAKVRTVRLLKIESPTISHELSKFPQFMECAEEYIVGYGFILKPERESKAFEILSNYGYCPFVQSKCEVKKPAPTEEWRKEFVIPWPEHKAPDYELKDVSDSETLHSALKTTKYGGDFQKLSDFELVQALRYAKTMEVLMGAKVKDPTKRGAKEEVKHFFVHALKISRSPRVIDIVPYGSDNHEILDMSFIQEIKVFNGKQL